MAERKQKQTTEVKETGKQRKAVASPLQSAPLPTPLNLITGLESQVASIRRLGEMRGYPAVLDTGFDPNLRTTPWADDPSRDK